MLFHGRYLIILLIFSSFFTLYAQESSYPMVVRFNYTCLNFEIIDDPNTSDWKVADILNAKGKEQLRPLLDLYPTFAELEVRKIFRNLTTKDTVSISRLGQKVTIPPFWATFQVIVPLEMDYFRLMYQINKQTRLIDYVHPEYTIELTSTPDDTLYHKQHSLNESHPDAHINIEEAWEIETGKPFIKVSVHDDGIDTLHPDLRVLYGAGYDASDFPQNAWGLPGAAGHGTSVAGVIGARRNNETGIAGIAGGDGSDTTGCSLIDIKYLFSAPPPSSSFFMAGVVDAARSVGSYWEYPYPQVGSPYFDNAQGFGVHVANHSYTIRVDPPQQLIGDRGLPDQEVSFTECPTCREAFLFSLKNGVINVVARGNSGNVSNNGVVDDPTTTEELFPQSLPDNWILSVGASGYDGKTIQDGVNQSVSEANDNFFSLYGGNMDLIAPGSDSIVYTTRSFEDYMDNPYRYTWGTSFAAPHVTGVVALLLSHYNKNCYSNKNLSIEDVEYILEHSATDLETPGYDELSGWGRLNAGEALKMIETPAKQIIHVDSLVSSNVIQLDTIALRYSEVLTADDWGPISKPWPLERNRLYQVERLLVENTYSFDEYILPTTQIIDYWARPSASNAVKYYEDTFSVVAAPQGAIDTFLVFDIFDLEPFDSIVAIDTVQNTVTTQGYYYHFISIYDPLIQSEEPDELIIDPFTDIDYWYPIDPTVDTARLVVSIYISDSTLVSYYDFPCDSLNLLYDEDFPFLSVEEEATDVLSIYPNPFDKSITIQFKDAVETKELMVYDLQGKLIDTHHTRNDRYTLNTRHYMSGFYFLSCRIGDETHSFKLIKL